MKKENISENYLKKIPMRAEHVGWSTDESTGLVTLSVENSGVMNRIAQKLFRKPKVSYIHLDEMGSFVWPKLDGKLDIVELGKQVDQHFGEKAHPLYERLAKYFQILESYQFIVWKQ